jgi:hypothetical protein
VSRTSKPQDEWRVDYYPTPAWCVHRMLEAADLPGGCWLEPAVGDGAIVRAVNSVRSDVRWTTIDVREDLGADLCSNFTAPICSKVVEEVRPPGGWDVAITNPPFSQADAFVEEALRRSRIVVMLLRLGWLAGGHRARFMRSRTPDVYVLPNRPSFTGKGTDSADYAWMVWGIGAGGRLSVLATTPTNERRAA